MRTKANRAKLDAYMKEAPTKVLLRAVRIGYGRTSMIDRDLVRSMRRMGTRWLSEGTNADIRIEGFLLMQIRQTNFQPNK